MVCKHSTTSTYSFKVKYNWRVVAKDDFLILGAGVVGLSIGISLLESNPKLKVRIVEKERELGAHASGRNSGVLHAGFYYSPDSLKAKFCKDGNRELRKLAAKFEIPVLDVGKVVVTKDEEQVTRLEELFERGIKNAVDVELLDEKYLPRYEPLARTSQKFLWSPTTAISNPLLIINAMETEFISKGGILEFSKQVEIVEENNEVVDKSKRFSARHYINATGSFSDLIAKGVGEAEDYAMIPFMGQYRSISRDQLPLRTLVYPVPHPINPFLGVHLTLTTDGRVKIGPTALPIFGREQYSPISGWSFVDVKQGITGVMSVAAGEAHSVTEIMRSEIPNIRLKNLITEGAKLVPQAAGIKKWAKKPPGIRAQLVHLPSGTLVQDFKVISYKNSTHILNAVSPGWTCSLPFGRYIVDQIYSPKKES